MKTFFKITILLLLTTVFFQSCTSNEIEESIVSSELAVTSNLGNKIISSVTISSDIDLINFDCDAIVTGYFRDYQGNQVPFSIDIENWDSEYDLFKSLVNLEYKLEYTEDGFFITSVDISLGGQSPTEILYEREQWTNYFEDCNYDGVITNTPIVEKVYVSEINYNCSGSVTYLVDGNIVIPDEETTPLSYTFAYLTDLLATYNFNNQTTYTTEDVYIENLEYNSPAGYPASAYTREDILNYFEDCILDREPNTNCLAFVYPLTVNRFSLQLEEVITTTIENDEDLATTFGTDVGELSIIFPINLLGANGTVVNIDSNEALDNALDNSATYCN